MTIIEASFIIVSWASFEIYEIINFEVIHAFVTLDWCLDIEAQIREIQAKKKEVQNVTTEKEQVGLGQTGFYDQDIYEGSDNKYEGYVTSIAANDEIEVTYRFLIRFDIFSFLAMTIVLAYSGGRLRA